MNPYSVGQARRASSSLVHRNYGNLCPRDQEDRLHDQEDRLHDQEDRHSCLSNKNGYLSSKTARRVGTGQTGMSVLLFFLRFYKF
jgi:hypothetical protein